MDEMMNVKPYRGDKSYIFISYSHQDKDVVLNIIRVMAEHGYRIWFDEGIDPGTEWPDFIAKRLSESDSCIAFLSAASLNSQNCRREIHYAIKQEKPLLAIYLEPVELSYGMDMQLSSIQGLFYFKDPKGFFTRLFDTPLLWPCKDVLYQSGSSFWTGSSCFKGYCGSGGRDVKSCFGKISIPGR